MKTDTLLEYYYLYRAAPDMRDALAELLFFLANNVEDRTPAFFAALEGTEYEPVTDARAALAKAEGR